MVRCLDEDAPRLLSPWKDISERNKEFQGRKFTSYVISGIQQIDYMEIFKKFTKNTLGEQESYRLDHIAEVVLGQNKLEYEGTLKQLYERDHQKYIDYNIVDVEIIERMEDELGLLNLVFTMAYMGGVNYTDTLGTVAIWDSIIFRELARKNIAVPPSRPRPKVPFMGGYVKPVVPGMFGWLMSFDLNSLYPNIIIQYNMSPETIVKRAQIHGTSPEQILKEQAALVASGDYAVTANGVCFSKEKQGHIPAIVEATYNKRVIIKKEMLKYKQLQENNDGTDYHTKIALLDTEQMAVKILMNSLYGAMGNRFFRYYDLDIAEGITLTGQLVNKWSDTHANAAVTKFLKESVPKDRVIAADTDSIYMDVQDIIDKYQPEDPVKFLDEISKRIIEPALEAGYDHLGKIMNIFKPTMVMSREVIANRGIWTAKKRYILNVLNSEGVQYAKPKMKIMGIEAIKSSTPRVCRDAMKEIFDIVIAKEESDVHGAIGKFRDKFFTLEAHEIGKPGGVSNVDKYYCPTTLFVKGTPQNSRACLVHNDMISKRGLDELIQPIQGGDKVKLVFLKKHNPTGQNVISFIDKLPVKFELGSFIDYEMQFTKTFLEPMKLIMDAIDWTCEPQASLADFFG